ncbi:protein BIG GRAIN 1-like E [Henckelia pumila]|uniref:protein BIG GRAIN 1-like E n=1 Tax=Henckelia pumila TaxID=405737 RepID=UPI003C6DFAB7
MLSKHHRTFPLTPMSVATGALSSSESCRNPFQWRNRSGELDVFEAARYFSGSNENPSYIYATKYDQYFTKNGTRMSLDMPKRSSSIPQDDRHHHSLEKQIMKENKKYKQPSSPGARLASFLNSLFNQKSLKKKKTKPKSGGKISDLEDEIPAGGFMRRKRRSSLGHFPFTNNFASSVPDWRSSFSASNSGFATPHAKTPTKSCKELAKSDYFRPGSVKNELHNEKRSTDHAWINIDERFSFRNGISEKVSRNGSSFEFSGHGKRSASSWGFHEYSSSEGREIVGKFSDADDHDGAESDSSSDLFDLPNYGSNFCSRTGLPVYETTKLDRIREYIV